MRAGVVPSLQRVVRFWGRHRAWAAAIALVVVLLGGATIDLLRIRSDLDKGRKAISGLQLDNLDAGLVPTISKAAARLHHANGIADHSPFLAALNLVPVLRDQVGGVRDLTHVADHLGQTGVGASQAIDKVLKQAGGDASKRVTLLDTVLQQLDVVQGVISKVHIGAHGRLLSPLAHARTKVVDELDRAPARLDQARFYVRGLRRLLAGPSNYLLLAGNNAEMRGGAGMPLSGGVVTITDGNIAFGQFKQLSELRFGSPPVTYPASWNNTYRRWSLGRSYLETAVSPNFAITGPMYQQMAPAAGFGNVDGVLEVDAVALRNLLEVIGPVSYGGKTYDAGNVEQQVLNENYLRFATIEGDRGNRVELQGELAKAIFEAFKARNVPIAKLASALRQAAHGRHLLAHSTDPAVESLWRSIGADGSLFPTGLMVAAENVAANKLDWYLQPQVTLNVLPSIDGSWKARLTVSITNPVLKRTSPQVDGTYDHLTNGTHRTMLAVYLPRRGLRHPLPRPALHRSRTRSAPADGGQAVRDPPRHHEAGEHGVLVAEGLLRRADPALGAGPPDGLPRQRHQGHRCRADTRLLGAASRAQQRTGRARGGRRAGPGRGTGRPHRRSLPPPARERAPDAGRARPRAARAGLRRRAVPRRDRRAGGRGPDQRDDVAPPPDRYASVIAPRSAPLARRAYLARTPLV